MSNSGPNNFNNNSNNNNNNNNNNGNNHVLGGNANTTKAPTLVTRKIAVLGARAVGKTSLVKAFVNNTYGMNYEATIESTFHKTVRFRKVHFATDIVDTAGMDEFSGLSRTASLGVHGYVLVFSVASRSSFEAIRGQVNDVLINTLGGAPNVPRVLVGTMCDVDETSNNEYVLGGSQNKGILTGKVRQVSRDDAQALAEYWKVPYVECSSVTRENVPEVFHTLLREVEKEDGLLVEQEEGGCVVM
eukprot:Nitzschia sp. Nitz4//scaffold19_size178191//149550//150284//NITZ4_002007-RA/size178191-processed-gene-0.31-mRNA-1//1//CDS//3329540771//1993//frame0